MDEDFLMRPSENGDCLYGQHEDIRILYGVPVMPIEELPQVCTICGRKFTYSPDLVFVSFPEITSSDPNVVIEKVTFSRLNIDKE
jgi:hypothetical protein